ITWALTILKLGGPAAARGVGMAYKPISEYGVIGDMHSAALVGSDGSIDWLCFPRFDSPSVFAAILDEKKGGRCQIRPVEEFSRHHSYLPESNVLVTDLTTPSGSGGGGPPPFLSGSAGERR